MKKTKEITRVELAPYNVCDICGKEIVLEKFGRNRGATTVTPGCFSFKDDGEVYSQYTIELCEGCVVDKLVPWVESFGQTRIIEEVTKERVTEE